MNDYRKQQLWAVLQYLERDQVSPAAYKYPLNVLTPNIRQAYIWGMMTLASYLSASNTSQAEFALAVGVKQPTVHRWLKGARPSWDTAAKIEKATNGAVPIAVWADHYSSPSSGSNQPDGSCLPKKGGDAATDIQGDAA